MDSASIDRVLLKIMNIADRDKKDQILCMFMHYNSSMQLCNDRIKNYYQDINTIKQRIELLLNYDFDRDSFEDYVIKSSAIH
jgi:hypothetical protein